MSPGQTQPYYIPPSGKIKTPRRPHTLSRSPRAGRFSRCAPGVLLLGLSLLCACAAVPRLEPVAAPTQPSVTLAEAGVRLTLLPNTWSAYPSDLPRYYTPIQIQIENLLGEEVQVRYEDFLALDDGRQQYRAVPPGEVARAMSGSARPSGPSLVGPRPTLVAGPWYPYWPRYRGPYYGFYGSGWYSDPYYSSYPYGWPQLSAQNVLILGLREGRLLPGASIQGFLYLQRATAHGNLLTVSWTPRLADGASLETLSAQFRIVR
jgi:hypothetical protein